MNLNLQLSLFVVGVVLLVIVYLVTRWSSRQNPSSKEDQDEDRIAGDPDELGPDPVLDREKPESGADAHRGSGEKPGDAIPSFDLTDEGRSGDLEAAVAREDDGPREGDQGAGIPTLEVEVMPEEYAAEPGHPVSGAGRDECEGRKGLRGDGTDDPNGSPGQGGSGEKPALPDSGPVATSGSDENDDSPEDEPAFPYPDMLDRKDPDTGELEEEVRVEPTLEVEEDYQEFRTGHPGTALEDPADFIYPEIHGFVRVAQIDYWAKIFGDRDVGRETVIAQYRAGASALSDKCRIFGQKVPDEKWFDMEKEAEGARFNGIVVSIQLAGPNGPVSAWELDRFVRMVEKIALGTGRDYSFMADKKSALQQARAIDEFIRHYDSVHLVNVKPVQANYMNGRDIERAAMQLGLEKGEKNFFVRYKKAGKEKVSLYCLVNMNETGEFDFEDFPGLSTEGVIFFSRPATNRSPGAVFAEMADTAKSFASRVQAEALSENNEDLTQDCVDRIRRSIEDTANEMQALGLASGSEEAMRIFRSY